MPGSHVNLALFLEGSLWILVIQWQAFEPLLRALDEDADGVLSFDEFATFVTAAIPLQNPKAKSGWRAFVEPEQLAHETYHLVEGLARVGQRRESRRCSGASRNSRSLRGDNLSVSSPSWRLSENRSSGGSGGGGGFNRSSGGSGGGGGVNRSSGGSGGGEGDPSGRSSPGSLLSRQNTSGDSPIDATHSPGGAEGGVNSRLRWRRVPHVDVPTLLRAGELLIRDADLPASRVAAERMRGLQFEDGELFAVLRALFGSPTEEDISSAYDLFNADGEDGIDLDELLQMMPIFAEYQTEAEVGAVFDAADADADGKLDRSEFKALLGLIKPVAPTARELHESRALLGRVFPRDPPTHWPPDAYPPPTP